MTTNLERIRQMNSDELAEFLYIKNDCCAMCNYIETELCNGSCNSSSGIKQWLELESEE